MKQTNLIFVAFIAIAIIFSGCKKEEFMVTFHPNGGAGTMPAQTFEAGKSQTLTANAFTNKGYTFTGWNTNQKGTGKAYKDKEMISAVNNMTLYAQWVVMDIDGNIYETVKIGNQLWLKQNLRTTKYRTGESIPVVAHDGHWETTTAPAMCYINISNATVSIHGALYNGYAAAGGKLCPEGWRLPSESDWEQLANYLGGKEIAGYKLKTTNGWSFHGTNNGNGSNESGFTAYPVGCRYMTGDFIGWGLQTIFWNSTEGSFQYLLYSDKRLHTANDEHQSVGCSVRCIKE